MDIKSLKLEKLPSAMFSYWLRFYKPFFILLFLSSVLLCSFIWYDTFYRFRWSDEKKKQHTMTQSRNIDLKEDEFNRIVEVVERREANFNYNIERLKDIFKSE